MVGCPHARLQCQRHWHTSNVKSTKGLKWVGDQKSLMMGLLWEPIMNELSFGHHSKVLATPHLLYLRFCPPWNKRQRLTN